MRGCAMAARHHVDLRGDHATGGGDDQLRDAGAGQRGDAAIGSALVAVRGVGVHAEAARGAANGGRIEPRGFDEHVARGVGNHRGFAAHHSGNGHGLDGVGDDEVFGQQLALDAVECGDAFRPRGRGAR